MSAKANKRPQITREQADDLIRRHTVEVSDPAVPKQPKVSVRIITYNHARFIAQALDSALMQRTDFPYEIVVGDDHSTDETTEIILDYQKRYPNKIRVLLATENLGKSTDNGRLNFIRTLQACRGEYIAFLDGDDYWTDPQKLRKQVDLMESQPDITLCGHRVRVISEKQTDLPQVYPDRHQPPILTVADVMLHYLFCTCSMVIRREITREFPKWMLHTPTADWPLQAIAAARGKVMCLDAVMGCYRVHSGGYWSSFNTFQRVEAWAEFYKDIRPHVPADCWRKIASTRFAEYAKICRADHPFKAAYFYLLSFQADPKHLKRFCAVAYYLVVASVRWLRSIVVSRPSG